MADPQLENGYTRIANDILEALCRVRVPGEVRQIFDVILRKTYGFNKKADRISLSQFVLATGMKKPSIIRAQKAGVYHKLIYRNANDEWRILKDYSVWIPFTKKLTMELRISKKVNPSLAEVLPTKDTTTKERDTRTAGEPAAVEKSGGFEPVGATVKKLVPPKRKGGATHEWQDCACRMWKALGLTGGPTSSFFAEFRDHRALAETVASGMVRDGIRPDDPETYFYKLMAIRLKQ